MPATTSSTSCSRSPTTPLTKCPKCKKKKLRRLFGTGAAIIFKGSGFYETDYRSESYKAGAKAETDAAKPADDQERHPARRRNRPTPSRAAKPAKPTGKGGAKGKAGTTGKSD